MRFELVDKLVEQREKMAEAAQAFRDREEQAKQELEALKRQYEQTILQSVREGKDMTKELDALSEQIAAAEKAYKRRQEERAAYSNIPNRISITQEDIVREWNEVFRPHVVETRLNPTLKRLLRAKKELIDATMDYLALNKEVTDEINRTVDVAGESVRYKLKGVAFDYRKDVEKYFVTEDDLYWLSRGEMPRSFQYVDPKEYE
ncbi:hypothetical protein M4D57_20270 [Brevibacillus borstelensis]|uniref:hypothetical protein n=1 Tax=Brevibacillus borstelensis TaxID=45462 RepID=UPI00203D30C8|nr:hypothetical protein [Brevibacillus borstelensis]MCM3560903.1 hypothetical protein [Brevibacillus borstelensis]